MQVRLRVQRGDVPTDAGLADELAGAAPGTGVPELLSVGYAGAAQLLLAQHRPEEVRSLLVELSGIAAVRVDPYFGALLPELVRCALAVGDHDLAAGLADGIEPRSPLIARCLASVRSALAEDAALFAGAAEGWREFGQPLEEGYALLGQGRCLVDAGDPGAAAPLRRAREIFTAAGFGPALDEVAALLAQ